MLRSSQITEKAVPQYIDPEPGNRDMRRNGFTRAIRSAVCDTPLAASED